jgi:hypothetical protein
VHPKRSAEGLGEAQNLKMVDLRVENRLLSETPPVAIRQVQDGLCGKGRAKSAQIPINHRDHAFDALRVIGRNARIRFEGTPNSFFMW